MNVLIGKTFCAGFLAFLLVVMILAGTLAMQNAEHGRRTLFVVNLACLVVLVAVAGLQALAMQNAEHGRWTLFVVNRACLVVLAAVAGLQVFFLRR